MLYALCLNNDIQLINFLVEEQGVNILQHLFEKVGVCGKFNKEFVELLYKIVDLPTLLLTKQAIKVITSIFEKLIFNIDIWKNSDYSVQVLILNKI